MMFYPLSSVARHSRSTFQRRLVVVLRYLLVRTQPSVGVFLLKEMKGLPATTCGE